MKDLANALLLLAVLIGHLAVCCAAYNQTHATAIPRGLRKFTQLVILLTWLIVSIWILIGFAANWQVLAAETSKIWRGYEVLCLVATTWVTIRFVWRLLSTRRDFRVVLSRSDFHVADEVPGGKDELLLSWDARLLDRVPGNQTTHLSVECLRFFFADLPPDLRGLKILQLSDLHLTGKLGQPFFRFVVERGMAMQPDLICVCGDVVDEAPCLEWLPKLFAELQAPLGVHYVLGNHDRRIREESALRSLLSDIGWQRAAGVWRPLSVGTAKLWIAGNELPWFPGARELPPLPTVSPGEPQFGLLLSHSPDQIEFARARNVDLMLAGHTHGGQIRLPLIGPIVAPSRFGVKFAAGSFLQGSTRLHVSRGLSGDVSIRWNCPPELTLIELASNPETA